MFKPYGKSVADLLHWLGGAYQVGLCDEFGCYVADISQADRGRYSIFGVTGDPSNLHIDAHIDGKPVKVLAQRLRGA